jgi:putative membrane protein
VKLLRVCLFLLGAALLALLVMQNDPVATREAIRRVGWRAGAIVVFPFVPVMLLDTLGWRYAFRVDRVPFWTLVYVRLAGEAVNMVTPTAALGGEAVKAWLLRDRAPVDEVVASVVVAKTTITIGQGLFLLVGVVVAWQVALPGGWLPGMLWLLGAEVVALGLFVLAQVRGMFAWSTWLMERLRARSPRLAGALARIDEGLAAFYTREPRRLLLSIGFHFAAWVLGTLEAWLILRLLDVDVSLALATIIEAFANAIRFATFLVPASVGVLEGGYVAMFGPLGLAASTAIAFGLVRRVRELVWIVAGLVVFAALRARPPAKRVV